MVVKQIRGESQSGSRVEKAYLLQTTSPTDNGGVGYEMSRNINTPRRKLN